MHQVSFRNESMIPRLNSAQWADIYIPSRPQFSPRLLSDTEEHISRLSLHPTAPFRIGLSMLSTLSRDYNISLMDTSQVDHEWDGSSPLLLKLAWSRRDSGFVTFVVVLGRCTCNPWKDIFGPEVYATIEFDPDQTFLGPHFINVQEGSDLMPRDPSHNCKEDHVEAGTTRRWRLPETESQWQEPCDLQFSLTRSHLSDDSASSDDSTDMLEVHFTVVEGLEEPIVAIKNRVRPLLHPLHSDLLSLAIINTWL